MVAVSSPPKGTKTTILTATTPASAEPTRPVFSPHETQLVDATNLIVGRLASYVAQQLLHGYSITILNAENAVFTGNPKILAKLWHTRLDLRPKGNPEFGPRFSCMPDRIVRKIVEGMVPSKSERGRNALKRLRVYIGTPAHLSGKKTQALVSAQNHKTKGITSVKELAQTLGYHLRV